MFNKAFKSVVIASSVAADQEFLREGAHDHPKVQASANRVKLEVRGNHDYYGHLFVG
jgi:hypothetical protein